jgi:hypothetical protein
VTGEKFVDKTTYTPDIDRAAVLTATENFWGDVLIRTLLDARGHNIARGNDGDAKVGDFPEIRVGP